MSELQKTLDQIGQLIKQGPSRPGLVPQSGDPAHPGRWVRPDAEKPMKDPGRRGTGGERFANDDEMNNWIDASGAEEIGGTSEGDAVWRHPERGNFTVRPVGREGSRIRWHGDKPPSEI